MSVFNLLLFFCLTTKHFKIKAATSFFKRCQKNCISDASELNFIIFQNTILQACLLNFSLCIEKPVHNFYSYLIISEIVINKRY